LIPELRATIEAALRGRDLGTAIAALRQLSARFETAAESSGPRPSEQAELGDLWCAVMDYEAAERCYSRALELMPRQARLWANRAAVRVFLGRLEAAEADYDQAIELDPQDAQSYLNRADVRAQSPEHNHIAELERALAHCGQRWRQEVPLRYALAKEYEDLEEYERSWQHLSTGSALRRRHLEYDPHQDLATVEWLIAAFPAEIEARPRGAESHEPIFIIGMPRTGSTLVDRILGNHPQVYSAGELPDFGAAVVAQVQAHRGSNLTRQQLIEGSAQIDFKALGEEYLRRTRPRTGHTPFFTDKLPLNYLYVGLIARALPHARIVHVTRGPMATCYGVFKRLFNQGYPFSYDQIELADHYLAYRRLMSHWHAVVPGRLIEIAYEDLVADLSTQARRLLDALGLPWAERCLHIHENAAPVATASAAQVRQPLHTRALRLWEHYARELAPLAARLSAGGIPIETE
jgi:tetratricopeptide (TPR) repeat protein